MLCSTWTSKSPLSERIKESNDSFIPQTRSQPLCAPAPATPRRLRMVLNPPATASFTPDSLSGSF